MSIFTIYKATNSITGLSYIGYTSNLKTRIKMHKIECGRDPKPNKFYCAIKELGWDNFQWDILYQSWDKNHCEYIMEPYFISEYNTFRNGYNSNNGKCQKLVDYYTSVYNQ